MTYALLIGIAVYFAYRRAGVAWQIWSDLMSKRARDHGDKRDWQKKWADNACPINWQDLGTSSPPLDHQRKAERIAEPTQQPEPAPAGSSI